MRIVHLLNHSLAANGHVEMAVDLACEQASRGHEVSFASGPGDFGDCLEKNGVEFVEFPDSGGLSGNLRFLASFIRFVRRKKPEIVNAHMVKAALIARAAKLVGSYGLVTTVHNSFDRQSLMMSVGDRVIAVSDAVKAEMATRGIPFARLRTVHNGTIGGRRRPKQPEQIRNLQRPSVVTVAGLHPRKGIADLIGAFKHVCDARPDAHLYLVGEGPCLEEYEEQAASLACHGNIHFEGYQRDPREYLGAADVFVLASHAEPCGLVTIEARQMGCAIVATDVGGTGEVLAGGDKGILVPAREPERLASAITGLLDNDIERQRLARAAATDLDYYTVARMSQETLAVYDELLNKVRR